MFGWLPRDRPTRQWSAAAGALLAFLVVTVALSRPTHPAGRLPAQYRLADLIATEQRSAAQLSTDVASLRAEVTKARAAAAQQAGGRPDRQQALEAASLAAGLRAVRGPALRATLRDSTLDVPPEGGNVNDLVIHSQDVQAVVNALWRAGAEAMTINGQRLVSSSAVLCVGNTLLLNGTVHSPPYVVTALGAKKESFDDDRLVKRLRSDAQTFGLGFAVERVSSVELPPYGGSTKLHYARPLVG